MSSDPNRSPFPIQLLPLECSDLFVRRQKEKSMESVYTNVSENDYSESIDIRSNGVKNCETAGVIKNQAQRDVMDNKNAGINSGNKTINKSEATVDSVDGEVVRRRKKVSIADEDITDDKVVYSSRKGDTVVNEMIDVGHKVGEPLTRNETLKMVNMNSSNMFCSRCQEGFEPQEKIVNSNGELWHTTCFVCAQCFRSFPDGTFYEFEGRKYCEHDFHVLFAPCCTKCNNFVVGRVIKAMGSSWHPMCFRCEECGKELAEMGFARHGTKALCHECKAHARSLDRDRHICHKCHELIDDKPLRWKGEVYHPYHFNCTACGVELNSDAREVKSRPGYTANDLNELYCLRCHDKMGIPICGACRRPIEERVVTALGKHWHVEHFVCAKCEKPFKGHRHYEKKGLAYCETHYHQLFGNLCFICNQVISGDVVSALNKAWCSHHFACSLCDQKMAPKTKFHELDLKPVCKKCFDKLPAEMRKRLRKAQDHTPKKLQTPN